MESGREGQTRQRSAVYRVDGMRKTVSRTKGVGRGHGGPTDLFDDAVAGCLRHRRGRQVRLGRAFLVAMVHASLNPRERSRFRQPLSS